MDETDGAGNAEHDAQNGRAASLWKRVVTPVSAVVTASTEALSNAARSAGETVGKGVTAGVETLGAAADAGLDAARTAAEIGTDAGRRVADVASSAAEAVASSTIVVTAGDAIGNAAAVTKEAVAEAAVSAGDSLDRAAARTKNAVASAAATVTVTVVAGAAAGAEAASAGAQAGKRAVYGGVEYVRAAAEHGAGIVSAAMATDLAKQTNAWLQDLVHAPASVYDRAMDAVHIDQHLGGLHRMFDGGHDLAGAWRAISGAIPEDTPLHEQIAGYLHALAKDVTTPRGLPYLSWDKATFDETAAFLSENFGITKTWLADFASYTASELIGSTVGALAAILCWDQAQIARFASLASSLGISSMAAINPALFVVAAVSLALAIYQARPEGQSGLTKIVDGVARGGIGSVTMLTVSALLPGPVLVGFVVGVVAAMLARHAYDMGREKLAGSGVGVADLTDYVLRAVGWRAEPAPLLLPAP